MTPNATICAEEAVYEHLKNLQKEFSNQQQPKKTRPLLILPRQLKPTNHESKPQKIQERTPAPIAANGKPGRRKLSTRRGYARNEDFGS